MQDQRLYFIFTWYPPETQTRSVLGPGQPEIFPFATIFARYDISLLVSGAVRTRSEGDSVRWTMFGDLQLPNDGICNARPVPIADVLSQ